MAKYKGFLVKIKVSYRFFSQIKGQTKLKVFKGFKGSPRGPAFINPSPAEPGYVLPLQTE